MTICARRKEELERAADEIRKATGGQVLAHVNPRTAKALGLTIPQPVRIRADQVIQ